MEELFCLRLPLLSDKPFFLLWVGKRTASQEINQLSFFQVLEQPALEQVQLALEQPARLHSVSREVVSVVPSNPPQGAGLDVQLPASTSPQVVPK